MASVTRPAKRMALRISRFLLNLCEIQTMFKEEAYGNQQKMQQLQKEKEAVELKNTNLMKELELARKLENFAAS